LGASEVQLPLALRDIMPASTQTTLKELSVPSFSDEPATLEGINAAWVESLNGLQESSTYTYNSLISSRSLSNSTESDTANIIAKLDLQPLPGPGGHMQINVFAMGDLPISFASDRFKKKFGMVSRYELFTNWVVDSRAFVEWVMSRTDAIFSGLQKPGAEEFGQLTVLQRGNQRRASHTEPEPRMVAALFPEPVGPRETYRISVRIGVRAADATSEFDGVKVPDPEELPDKIVMPSSLPSGKGASGKKLISL